MSTTPVGAEARPLRVAAVLTCHNRRDKTQACLQGLRQAASELAGRIEVTAYVTDDGSNDGTGEMLREHFSEARVLRGDGNLFWNGGMHRAFGQALRERHDFYLWLNDDTELFPDTLSRLLATHATLCREQGDGGIVVGSTCDTHGRRSYGGMRRPPGARALRFEPIEPTDAALPCTTFNGNCVLICARSAERLGNLDPAFRHGIGDMDYGLRANRLGIPIRVMAGYAGRCSHDHRIEGSYLDRTLPLSARWHKITSPKGLPPRAWAIFCSRHTGLYWPAYWLWPYLRVVLTSCGSKRFCGI